MTKLNIYTGIYSLSAALDLEINSESYFYILNFFGEKPNTVSNLLLKELGGSKR